MNRKTNVWRAIDACSKASQLLELSDEEYKKSSKKALRRAGEALSDIGSHFDSLSEKSENRITEAAEFSYLGGITQLETKEEALAVIRTAYNPMGVNSKKEELIINSLKDKIKTLINRYTEAVKSSNSDTVKSELSAKIEYWYSRLERL